MGAYAHTLPTDHIYFYFHQGMQGPVPVIAPASGTVTKGLNQGADSKVWVQVNATFSYYVIHIIPAPGVIAGSRVEGGRRMGDAAGIAFDLGVQNANMRQAFVNPARYGHDTERTDAPLKEFEAGLRQTLYGKVRLVSDDLDGRINYDVAGTLSGGWFAEDLAVSNSSNGDDPSVGMRQLAFARDAWMPDRLRISIGGLNMTVLYGIPPDTADFSAVTLASGPVTYRLLNTGEPGGPPGRDQLGLLLVEMLDASRIRVEAVQTRAGTGATLSSESRVYVR